MEAYVKEEELSTVITNMCYVLRTIKFNDAVLESLVGENVLSYKEENFTLFNTTDSKEVYLQAAEDGYVEEEKDVFDDEEYRNLLECAKINYETKKEMLEQVKDMIKIAVDAMGGDNAPDATIKGAVRAISEIKAEVVLIGNEEIINAKVKEFYGK